MDTKICVIAGIKRSGSTAAYNIARLGLMQAGYKVNIHGQDYKPRTVPDREVDICKIHPYRKYIAKAASHIILTDRDNKGILESLERMWGSGDPGRIKSMRKDLAAWGSHDHIMLEYDLLMQNETQYIEKILDYLDLDVSVKIVQEKFNQIEPPEDEYDPVTCLFPRHISDV